ncbi:uncharacterized protein F4812DRAFT_446596 [Daldinia caldariorum]|uniref:uncharacterized protein n=1 Tax=Daldinia caldariorum TaxID=326644 RepID=UPI002008364C|nr:uncharacterized protein F4812DRAFT_446596 [Daldinia caldariorum]KAI1463584.1 hypothetical protein F4812DRAFT_446596 [Daldinia caldariorum]
MCCHFFHFKLVELAPVSSCHNGLACIYTALQLHCITLHILLFHKSPLFFFSFFLLYPFSYPILSYPIPPYFCSFWLP